MTTHDSGAQAYIDGLSESDVPHSPQVGERIRREAWLTGYHAEKQRRAAHRELPAIAHETPADPIPRIEPDKVVRDWWNND